MNRTRTNPQGVPTINGSLAHWEELEAPFAFEHSPCNAVLVDEAAATITGTDAEGSAATSPPLAANLWHAMSFASITATSAASGKVWIGWYHR